MTATAAYREARDELLRLREDYERAVTAWHWPEVGERFNWAVDWFDAVDAAAAGVAPGGEWRDDQFPELRR